MKLRTIGLISTLALGLLAAPLPTEAQKARQIPRIGFLIASSASSQKPRLEAFKQGLRDLGYVEGKTITIEIGSAEGKRNLLPGVAAELVRLKVDVIVTGGPTSTRAAKKATATLPIVMAGGTNPVGRKFVASLARPGGNITGLSTISSDLIGKRLELLKEVVQKLSRVAVIITRRKQSRRIKDIKVNAQALSLQHQIVRVGSAKDIETAFREAKQGRAEAVYALAVPVLLSQRAQVAELAVKNRLPVIYPRKEFVEAGGLMVYAASITDVSRRAAIYVDKILKGSNPGDLPVEQPTKFELIINLKAAKRIGLKIPPEVLYRATKVIK